MDTEVTCAPVEGVFVGDPELCALYGYGYLSTILASNFDDSD